MRHRAGPAGRSRRPHGRTRRAFLIANHDHLVAHLNSLLEAILPGDAIADHRLAEAIIRLIGMMLRLAEEHAPDHRGRCPICRRCTCPILTMNPPATRTPRIPRRDNDAAGTPPTGLPADT